ncbi:hypothetical protein DERP_011659 [Dermatophagoides pteronyssinus]|uniref:Uncharacterized protein n=1 Tax=Dermatophagoides pteronyssinus TaxID=6956 RepID=A0ABQ8JWQ2_DERPT|nr:hypothetical protein DERP_011659 [Dermatophagoides pteronyssinus]
MDSNELQLTTIHCSKTSIEDIERSKIRSMAMIFSKQTRRKDSNEMNEFERTILSRLVMNDYIDSSNSNNHSISLNVSIFI